MPIRMSMIRPMPFCPSFEPWAKLTPAQVSINTNRIHNGGGVSPLGARYSSGLCTKSLAIRRSRAAPQNPTIGENKREQPTSPAFAQLSPSPKTLPLERTEFASPTPIMEPIKVWELEAGRPKNQVPRFQIMEDNRRANTMANPAPVPTFSTSSTGRRATTPKATAPDEVSTPMRFQIPDQITAVFARRVRV